MRTAPTVRGAEICHPPFGQFANAGSLDGSERCTLRSARHAKRRDIGISGCSTASLRTWTGTCRVLVDPAGKKAISPALRRRSSPRSLVIVTSPDMIWTISSSEYSHLNRPALQSQAIIAMVPSWLLASSLARARGAPSKTQLGLIGIKSSCTVAGAAVTMDCDMIASLGGEGSLPAPCELRSLPTKTFHLSSGSIHKRICAFRLQH